MHHGRPQRQLKEAPRWLMTIGGYRGTAVPTVRDHLYLSIIFSQYCSIAQTTPAAPSGFLVRAQSMATIYYTLGIQTKTKPCPLPIAHASESE